MTTCEGSPSGLPTIARHLDTLLEQADDYGDRAIACAKAGNDYGDRRFMALRRRAMAEYVRIARKEGWL